MIENLFKKMHENLFSTLYLILSAIMLLVAITFNFVFLEIISISLFKVAIYLLTFSGFTMFLNGSKCNILKKIFDEGNLAAGTSLAGIAIGIAIVIAVAI